MPNLPRSVFGLTLLALFVSAAPAQQGKNGRALGRSDAKVQTSQPQQIGEKSTVRRTHFEWSELLRFQESLPPGSMQVQVDELVRSMAQPESVDGLVVEEVEVNDFKRGRRDHVLPVDSETPRTPGGIERLGPCVGFGAAPAASLSTAGQGDGPDGFATLFYPPNPAGSVGPNHLMVMAPNITLIQNRLGASLAAVNTITFWFPAGAPSMVRHCRLYYDDVAGRWLASALGGPEAVGATSILLAISDTDSPAGGWDYYFWAADPTFTTFADHPKMGYGANHVVIVADMFTGTGAGTAKGTRLYILDKPALIAATPVTLAITGNDDWALASGVFPGSFVNWRLQPSRALDTSVSEVWISNTRATSGASILYQFGTVGGTGPAPTLSFPFGSGLYLAGNYTNLRQPIGQLAPEARGIDPQPPDGQQASNRARYFDAVIRNGHVYQVNCTGQPGTNTAPVTRNNVNFYEVDVSATPFLAPFVQQVAITTGADTSLAFPSLAVNCGNDVLIGMTSADSTTIAGGPTRYLDAATCMRLGTDPLNTMGAVTPLKAGVDNWWQDSPAPQGGGTPLALPGLGAWGYYSTTSVDPNDDTTLWTLQPYSETRVGVADADSRWGTWWGRFGDCETLPVITVQPTGHTGCIGDFKTFTVTATTGANPLTYQWRLDGVDIAGATNTSYVLAPSVASDEGTYDCVICGCGQVISDPAVLDFQQPSITTQPVDTFTPYGGSASFTVAATPFLGTNSYQWIHEGNPVGTDSDTYTIVSAVGQDYGEYHCVITDSCGVVVSDSALLEPYHELTKQTKGTRIIDIVVEPTGQKGCVNDSVEFHVLAAPPGSTFQWRKNGVDLPSQTNDTLVLSTLNFLSAGHYDVMVDTGTQVLQSHDAILEMADNPLITQQPADVTVSSSTEVTFHTGAADNGDGPLRYQWKFEPATSQGFNNVPGAIGPTMVLNEVTSANAGRYRCFVFNKCGFTASRVARLTVL